MSIKWPALLAAVFPVLAYAATAQVLTPKVLSGMSNEALLASFEDAAKDDDNNCRRAAILGELAHRRASARILATHKFLDGVCGLMTGNPKTALADFNNAEELFPKDIDIALRQRTDLLAAISAIRANDGNSFAKHVGHIANRDDPDEFAALDGQVWPPLFRAAPKESAQNSALALASSTAFKKLPQETANSVRYWAILPALKAGETGLAARLATVEPDPFDLVEWLIDRSYSRIWRELEVAAGPQLGRALSDDLAAAVAAVNAAPDDRKALSHLIRARLWNGDATGAIAAGAAIDRSIEGLTKIGEDEGWALDSLVSAYDVLGQNGAGDAIYDGLAKQNVDERRWLANFVINRADRLVGQGRWREALPAAELAVTVAARHGTAYAREVAAVDRYCAAIGTESARAELAQWWSAIAANWRDNVAAAVQAAQCKGDPASARDFIRHGLEGENTRSTVIKLLQPQAIDYFRDTRNLREEPRLLLDGDPALKMLFLKFGREMPATLLPRGGRGK